MWFLRGGFQKGFFSLLPLNFLNTEVKMMVSTQQNQHFGLSSAEGWDSVLRPLQLVWPL